jgi:outer membrane protein assembly factor BamE
MTRSQVRFLLGTPLVTDAFHPDRWDYLYLDRKQGKLVAERRLTLWFEGDKLTRAVTNAPAPPAQAQPSTPPAQTQQTAPPAQAQPSAAPAQTQQTGRPRDQQSAPSGQVTRGAEPLPA